ncbi:MAG: hypothetical protein WAN65_15710 [Candidatus Sulfotelmatobacter sp.]
MKKWANVITHAVFFAGLLSLAIAGAMVYRPLGVLILGAELTWLAILSSQGNPH